MQDLAQGAYTAEEVRAVLHGSAPQIKFRYELLDSDNQHKAWLRGVSDRGNSVSNNALADIKRTANFVITEGIDEINYVSDRIKPYFRLLMPAKYEQQLDHTVTNIALFSEDFSDAFWTKTRSVVISNAAVAPDGTMTADKLREDGSVTNSHHIERFDLSTDGQPATLSIYAKAAERTWMWISAGLTGSYAAWFDLANGVLGTVRAGVTAEIESIGDGWYRCSLTEDSVINGAGSAGSDDFRFGLSTGDLVSSYTGDSVSGIYIWGAQDETNDEANEYVRTLGVANSLNFYELVETRAEEWIEWPQGIFLLSTPPRSIDEANLVTREVDAYDQLQVMADDKVDDRWTILAGENYISGTNGAKDLLDSAGITLQNLTATSSVLPTDREWPPGTSKLAIFNDLMGAISYRSLFFDENGYATARPYVTPSTAPIEYTYADNSESVVFPEAEETLDLFAIPNKWVGVVSESDRDPLRSVYINDNPNSITSTVSRDRTIQADLITLDAADQTALDEQVARIAFEASQVYESVEFSTGIMPHHGDADVFRVELSRLGISDRYSEHTWTLPLEIGAKMTHRVRRVVSV